MPPMHCAMCARPRVSQSQRSRVRSLLWRRGGARGLLHPRKICPKIEKPQALTNIEGIIEKSQALMVARPATLRP